MTAIERIDEYARLEIEKGYENSELSANDSITINPNKPIVGEGAIEISDLTVKWRNDLHPALSGIDFKILPGQKGLLLFLYYILFV